MFGISSVRIKKHKLNMYHKDAEKKDERLKIDFAEVMKKSMEEKHRNIVENWPKISFGHQ